MIRERDIHRVTVCEAVKTKQPQAAQRMEQIGVAEADPFAGNSLVSHDGQKVQAAKVGRHDRVVDRFRQFGRAPESPGTGWRTPSLSCVT